MMTPQSIEKTPEGGDLGFISGELDFHPDEQQPDEVIFNDLHPALQDFRVSVFAAPVSNTTPARDVDWQGF